jgi:hypothetical protein
MSVASVDAATGSLLLDGSRVFPIVLSNGPPRDGNAPSGRNGLGEVRAAGVNFVRTGRADWNAQQIDSQVAAERALLDALASHGLHAWLWLGDLPDLPAPTPGGPPSQREQLLVKLADSLQSHPALGAYKSVDEPRNPFRGPNFVRPAGLVRGYRRLRQIDASHPVVIIQAPLGTVAELAPYRLAFDITGADVYPVSYPPGIHTRSANKDISVVGDVTKKMIRAAGGKPVWMTLQIAWGGVIPTKQHPQIVPRFPTLAAERFMAYEAIATGARGLAFFGGHLTEIASPADAAAGWNWTFWERVLQPVVTELSSAALRPALVAPDARPAIRASTADVELVARDDGDFLYVIAVRSRGATSMIAFSGLPSKLRRGEVLFEYMQEPPPPPVQPGHQIFRHVVVAGGSFRDWFAAHDAHVYRFKL